MNYLAHLYLSGNNEGLLVGNYIADGMKGTKVEDYPEEIQKGILLHRKIDHFTDSHAMFRSSKEHLFAEYSHYAAVLVDMFYDYLLANNWSKFSDIPLQEFADNCYVTLAKYNSIYTDKSASFLRYITKQNALYNYQFEDKFRITLTHLSSRLKNKYQLENSMDILNKHYTSFESEFLTFFPEIIAYVKKNDFNSL